MYRNYKYYCKEILESKQLEPMYLLYGTKAYPFISTSTKGLPSTCHAFHSLSALTGGCCFWKCHIL